ncbi:hypothetical protein EVG20_g7767, partial [Dentipellis fragilis]
MAYAVSRPHSPPPIDDLHGRRPGADFDLLSPALHNALDGISSHSSAPAPSSSSALRTPPQQPMTVEKEKLPNIEIVVTSDLLLLKGVGVDVAPALLQGHVVVNLAESTAIKEITLHFRGKARLPPPANEPCVCPFFSFFPPLTPPQSHHQQQPDDLPRLQPRLVFPRGSQEAQPYSQGRRHLFPFQLNIGGSLPSTINTNAFGGASVHYKLRAVATRPGFAHNLQTQIPISIARSFAPEALEYQQTLEIENTWPEKLMYSIMIPHKAWAAGDTLTAVVKLSPLAKGVRVLHVTTTLNETVKLYTRTGWQETTRPNTSCTHDIVDGHAVLVASIRIAVLAP